MPPHHPKWKFYPMRIALIALVIMFISACSAVGFPGVYRIDVEQGNIMDQEKVDQLQPGMSRRQVRFILGTPLVEDSFNNDRWDYAYVRRNGLNVLAESTLTIIFEGDSLQEVRGDVVPAAWADEPEEETSIEESISEEMPTPEAPATGTPAAESPAVN